VCSSDLGLPQAGKAKGPDCSGPSASFTLYD